MFLSFLLIVPRGKDNEKKTSQQLRKDLLQTKTLLTQLFVSATVLGKEDRRREADGQTSMIVTVSETDGRILLNARSIWH